MTRSLVAFVFVVLIIIIIFLMFQVNDNSNKCRETKLGDQDRLARASKLLVQSTTQDHPLLSFEAVIEAKHIMEDVVARHGGLTTAERNLKLPKGRLESLRTKIHEQYGTALERYPELNFLQATDTKNTTTTSSSSEPRVRGGPTHHRHDTREHHRRGHRH